MDEPAAERAQPWDGFLAGPENALAHAGVLALARGDADAISPLVLHGPAGAGKSRLLAGLVAERLARHPGAAVAHLSADAFAALCAEAARAPGGWADFRDRFRYLDLLALDDLHSLERTPWALAELAPTLDALHEGGAAVAVAARTGPSHWQGWPPRLVDRLLGGLALRVDPPGPASRRRYLLDRARARDLRLPAATADALVAADGYRALDGALARLAFAARLDGLPAADALLDDDPPAGPPALGDVVRAVARRFGLRASDLRSPSRRRTLVEPRHLAMLLAREATGLSFAALGAHFGGRDPKTVQHACRMASERLAADPSLAAAAEAIRSAWKTGDLIGGK